MSPVRKVSFVLMLMAATIGICTAGERANQEQGGMSAPKTCAIHVSGVSDWGTIPVESLNQFGPTDLGKKSRSLAVNCREPTLFALHISDDDANSVPPAFAGSFGMAPHDGKPVGAYALRLLNPMADGRSSAMARREGDSWVAQDAQLRPGSTIRFTDGSGNPDWSHNRIKELKADLEAAGTTVMRSELPASGTIHFHGAVTITVEYL